ncbi:MAG: 5'/3'-nucleotidase SurE [Porphyromonadaceae bacterium]|nr:5'/3'-nucleotidase SurE [Porphyromonadaceae bacterium]
MTVPAKERTASSHRPKILITNDDSIDAKGLHALVSYVSAFGEIRVVAPDRARSGQSGAITTKTPLSVQEVRRSDEALFYTCNGTPVDCVKLALHIFRDFRPDLILSGINHGSNAGISILYSGTMGAVLEGCVVGIPSIGFSLLSYEPDADFLPCRPYVEALVAKVLAEGLPQGVCLNVNFPLSPQGMRVCRQAPGYWTDEYEGCPTAEGKTEYFLTGRFVNIEPEAVDTDEYFLTQGFASVVPCTCDQTAYKEMSRISTLIEAICPK